MRKLRALDILTIVVLASAVLIALAERTGATGRAIAFFRARTQSRLLATHWPQIARAASPVWAQGAEGPLIVAAFQYSCGGCIEAAPSIRSASAGKTRLALLHIPLPQDSVGMKGAAISVCASLNNAGATAHDFLVSTSDWHREPADSIVHRFTRGENAKLITDCVAQGSWTKVVETHRSLSSRVSITYTPFLFGASGGSVPSESGLARLIERETAAVNPTNR